jgi:pimeloyl-ACP methyl ester carboxylesterase
LYLFKETSGKINSKDKKRVMSKILRLFKSFYRLLLPVFVLIVIAVIAASVWFVHMIASPPKTAYLVTPDKYGRLSSRGAQVTDETWKNRDGTTSRGWLLRGKKDAPAVILLHRYGANRSHMLNMGVKLNETTDYTVLMPDLRGHGENPQVKTTTFGGCEVEDTLAAIGYLKSLKTEDNQTLVGENVGIYGVELGALVALSAAAKDKNVKTLVLDSVPVRSDAVLAMAVDRRFPFAGFITSKMAEGGSYLYFATGCYERQKVCEIAKSVTDRNILLLAGADAPALRDSTANLSSCFPSQSNVKSFTDLNPSGFDIINASIEQGESYEQKVIYFMQSTLVNSP